MRVLYLTNLPSPYRVNFFSELGKLCELTVVYERRSAGDRHEKWKVQSESTFQEVFLDAFKIGTDNSCSFKVLQYLNKDYDQIVVGMYSTFTAMISILYMKINKIPFILSTDGGFVKEEKKIKKLFKQFFIRSADKWLSTGMMATQYLCHYGANKQRISTYPFTSLSEKDILLSPIEAADKITIKTKLRIKEEKIIISVGEFIYRKGFDLLIQASKDFNDGTIGIYFIGGKKTDEYIQLCEKNKISNIYFLDFMEKKDLLEYYKAADLFVLPTREDIWGLVINEAMGCGLPVITTDRCIAGTELIDNGQNGYIVPVNDVDELREKIPFILNNTNIKKYMSEQSLKKIRQYTFVNMAKSHMEILDDEINFSVRLREQVQ